MTMTLNPFQPSNPFPSGGPISGDAGPGRVLASILGLQNGMDPDVAGNLLRFGRGGRRGVGTPMPQPAPAPVTLAAPPAFNTLPQLPRWTPPILGQPQAGGIGPGGVPIYNGALGGAAPNFNPAPNGNTGIVPPPMPQAAPVKEQPGGKNPAAPPVMRPL